MNEIKLEALRVRSRIKIYMQDGKNASFFFGSVSDEYRSYYAKRYQLVDFDPNEAEYFFNFLVPPTGLTSVEQQGEVDADFFQD